MRELSYDVVSEDGEYTNITALLGEKKGRQSADEAG